MLPFTFDLGASQFRAVFDEAFKAKALNQGGKLKA